MPENKPEINLTPNICYLGLISSGKNDTSFGVLQEDRRKHLYILGKTGMGKTTLLENMALQDIYNGYGLCFLDPHGDSSEYIISRIPKHRQNDVIYLDPADTDFPVALNILESEKNEEPYLIASSLMAVFGRIWAGSWSSRMEYILNNTLLALLETPGNTLLGVIKMLTNENYRAKIVEKLRDPLVKNFWQQEFESFNSRYQQEAISPILNKIGQFFSSSIMRNILGQTHSTINLRQIMDTKKILIVNLSKGKLGEDNSNLFGSLLVAKLQTAAMSRVDTVEDKRTDFFMYVDEFQNFTTDSFASILSEARKYRLNLILAHQYIAQLTESGNNKVKNAIFGNVGTMLTFRLGAGDSHEIAREFLPKVTAQNLIQLNPTEIAIKLSIKGRLIDPFIAKTIPPIFKRLDGSREFVINMSRRQYAKKRELVETEINSWFAAGNLANLNPKSNSKYGKKKNAGNNSENKEAENLNSANSKENQLEPTKPKVIPSENVLKMSSQKAKINRVSLANQLQFNKKVFNSLDVKSDKITNFKADNLDKADFGLPG